jgi:3-oxoacyl-[acyl-carrier protein] reductase
MARAVLPGMVERGFGRVLFVSSVAAFNGGVVGPHYAASKAALHGLMHHLAPRVAGSGVTVNTLAPALIEGTRMLPSSDGGRLPMPVPVGHLGRPDDVAAMAVAMLANPYLTDKVITLDGGLYPA